MLDAAGRDALRRQGARPEEARRELLPEDGPRAAHRGDGRAGRARRDDGRRAPKARRCCSRTTSSRRTSRATTSCSATTRAIRTSASAGDAFPQLRFHRGALDRAQPLLRPVPERGRGARGHRARCRRCSSCAPARTRCSPTARGRACCTRSSAARAPCVGLISEADYREDVEGAALFLQGKTDEVLTQLQAQMDAAAAALEFERAARIRDKIAPAAAAAVAAVRRERDGRRHRRGRGGVERGLFARQRGDDPRRPPRRRPHLLSAACRGASTLAEVVPAFLAQHYVERPVPPTIIVAGRRRSMRRSRKCCPRSRAQKVEIVGNPGGERRVWLDDGDAERDARDPRRSSRRRRRRRTGSRRCRRRSACRRRRSASSASTSPTRWARRRSRRA